MKFKNIFLLGLSAMALVSCSDYLDVDAPSKNELDYVYSDKGEINRALNGIYAAMLSNSTYGCNFLQYFQLNSDVDFGTSTTPYETSSNYKRFDCDPDGGQLLSAWTAQYLGIERANIFIDRLPQSELFDSKEYGADLRHMLGEAKVLRAIFYHDLIWMFGDVPFAMLPTYKMDTKIYPVEDRTVILKTLIDDLIACSGDDDMKFAADNGGVEHIGKEMAWAMIARLALTAGGYSLRPDGETYGKMQRPDNYLEFYNIAMEYAGKVIESGTHHLSKPYYQVFVDECNFIVNNNDDPIFEIPFGSESTGRIGYIHGPRSQDLDGVTPHKFGKTSSSATLSPLYRFMFEEGDSRREYINQLFYYDNSGAAKLNAGRSVYNGKWSKLWNKAGMGDQSTEQTGINYPYMRYADVLLMYAEAVNEVENGLSGAHGAAAQAAYKEVRSRAFHNDLSKVVDLSGSKEEILKKILDERKFEFAGENMRWRDLVRNNLYNQQVYYSFWRLYQRGNDDDGANTEAVSTFDFGDPGRWDSNVLPMQMYVWANQTNEGVGSYTEEQFPNSELKVVKILNPYTRIASNDPLLTSNPNFKSASDQPLNMYNDSESRPRDELLYSFFGYIHYDEATGAIRINNNGTYQSAPEPTSFPTVESLPVVRYILPYPRTVIARAYGAYKNQYGYR